jgi:hypothetical protein
MTTDELRPHIPTVDVVAHDLYGINFKNGCAQCVFPDRHTHGDRDHSLRYDRPKDRIFCASQQCFGAKGVDAFGLVATVDGTNFRGAFAKLQSLYGAHLNGGSSGKNGARKTTVAVPYLKKRDPLLKNGWVVAETYAFGADLRKVKLVHGSRMQADKGRPEKTFLWEHRKHAGDWLSGDGGREKPLFANEYFRAGGEPVLGVEGEGKALFCERLGLPAFSFKVLSDSSAATLTSRDVVLWPDADQAGAGEAERAAAKIAPHAQTVALLAPPEGLPVGGDVVDAVERLGWNSAEVLAAMRAAKPFGVSPGKESGALPRLRVSGRELREISGETLDAVRAANDPPKLFSRAGSVVRVDSGEDGRGLITGVTDVHLRGEMTRAANFYKVTKRGEEFVETPVNPPLEVARDLLSRPIGEIGFPVLDAIAEAPFLRPDGSVVDKPGYDPATRTYFAPVGNMDGFFVPGRPSADDIDGARGMIEDVFAEFPFVDQSSRANAIALFISPELRPAIPGNVPAAFADAPQAGSGKTLLASVVSEKTSGSGAAMKPAPTRDEEEWRKTLTATIQTGQSLIIFDNVDHALNSSNLAIALTTGTWTDRVLGRTATITIPQRTMFVITGNNILLGGDLPRRCYWIRLDAQCSEPWRGREFRHPDLRQWVRENRGRLLGASLTLARAWFLAGCPAASTPVLGSFEEWCRIVGGVLEFAGIQGFLGNLDQLYKQSDPTVSAWEAFLDALLDRMPQSGFRVADVVTRIRDDAAIRALVPEDLGDMDPISSFQRRLGRSFLKRVGRRYGERGIRLVRLDTRQGVVIWGVQGGS